MMLEQEAASLAADLTETWRLGPSKRIWRDELLSWADYHAAARAYTHLRRHHTGSGRMEIATFAAEYQRQRRAGQPLEQITGCANCQDGWISFTYTAHGHTYHGCHPCTCRDGQRHVKLHRSIIDARTERNTATLDATPPPDHLLDDHTLFDHEHERTDA